MKGGLRQLVASMALAWLSLTGLVPSGLAELSRLPALAEHYQEHRATDAQLDWWRFLALHYADPEHRQTEDHSALPLYAPASLMAIPTVGAALEMPLSVTGMGGWAQAPHQGALSGAAVGVFHPPRG